ncbi:hypothetical protein DSO57_1005195 [Entomophthora muscae]|uniref:Uncharacterized protein n=1 Tax=Entomophthora muscae TaxID=34485 RepID=A0ACC2T7V9_9FUNG|nr:hypothetical protein DSO57_1005195 [Entomophthora muscae]
MQSAKLWCSSVKNSLLSFIYPTPEDNEVTFDAELSSPTAILEKSDFISNANTKSTFESSNESLPIHPNQTSQLLPEKYVLQTYPASEEKELSFDIKFIPPTVVCLEESVFNVYYDWKSSFDSSNESLPIHSDQPSQVLSEKPGLKSCIRRTASALTIDLSSTELKPSSSQYICPSAISAPAIALPSPELGPSSSQSICSSSASGKKLRKQTLDSFESSSEMPKSPSAKKYSDSVRMLLSMRLITLKNIQGK